MDKNNLELKEIIKKICPLIKPEILDLLIPPKESKTLKKNLHLFIKYHLSILKLIQSFMVIKKNGF
jgi:hypothetical protein